MAGTGQGRPIENYGHRAWTLGYGGRRGLAAADHDVTGLDIDDRKVQALQTRLVPIYELGLQECVAIAVDRGNLGFPLKTSRLRVRRS